MSKNTERIKVAVRCRPLSSKEKAEGYQKCVQINNERGEVVVQLPGQPTRNFFYDKVYDENSVQDVVFNETALAIVESVCQGYNGTIFAYGQTGTGKTFTMEGDFCTDKNKGIIPRSFDLMFNLIKGTYNTKYLISCSYLELYNEEVRDLLSKNHTQKLDIREDPDTGFYVEDLSTHIVSTPNDMINLMLQGRDLKVVKGHNMNERSSRSHCIFMITVENSVKDDNGNERISKGKLNLVDLAGSERTSKIKEAEGGTAGLQKETIHINLSLTALGKVICALVAEKKGHIPYRDSKLTKLLMDSLGGNSKTVMIANIGPADFNYEESVTTLRYADRAKNIKNSVKKNMDPKDAMILQYQEELNKLKQALSEANGGQIMDLSSFDDNMITPDSRKRMQEIENQFLQDKEAIQKANENEKKRIEESNKLVEAEKYKLLEELKKKQEEQEKQIKTKEKLAEKLKKLDNLFVIGEENEKKAKENEEILKKAQQELDQREKKRIQLQKELQENEEENLQLQTKFKDQDTEITEKSKIFEKLKIQLEKLKLEQDECRREYEISANQFIEQKKQLDKEMSYKNLIIDNIIPRKYLDKLEMMMDYDEDKEMWYAPGLEDLPNEEELMGKKKKMNRFDYDNEEDAYVYGQMNDIVIDPAMEYRTVYLSYDNIGKAAKMKKK